MQNSKKPIVSIIAAMGSNRALGKDNRLLWHIPEDFAWMKSHTKGHPIIMGRKTAKSIGKPLPNRTNIVITRSPDQFAPPYQTVPSLKEGIAMASRIDHDEIFIFGGGSVYEQAMPIADRLYLTIIDHSFDADTFFPSYQDFSQVVFENDSQNEQYRYTFFIRERPKTES